MMKRVFWAVAFLLCLMFLGHSDMVFCQDQITVGQGERISNLQLGLQNTGWVSYEAYAEAGGDAGHWISPATVMFGSVQPGQTKTATYTLIVPSDASPGTYNVHWRFYAYSGLLTRAQYLFTYTVTVTVLPSRRNPVTLVPLWALVCIVTLSPLWYWTKRKTVSEGAVFSIKSNRKLKEMVMNLLIVSTVFLSVSYVSWQVPLVPMVTFDSKLETTAIVRSNVVNVNTHSIQTSATTVASTSTQYRKEEDEIIVVTITSRSTITRSYQIQTTIWSTESIAKTYSFETTRHQTLSQTYPMLWLVLAVAFVGSSAIILTHARRTVMSSASQSIFDFSEDRGLSKTVKTDHRFEKLHIETTSLRAPLSVDRDIRKCFMKKVVGLILLPIVVGILVLYRASKQSRELSQKKAKFLESARNEIASNKSQIQDVVIEPTKKYITYLIWSVRDNWSTQLEDYMRILAALRQTSSRWPNDFSRDLVDFMKLVTEARSIIQSYNKEFVRLRKVQYQPLFAKSAVPLDDEQKTAIVTDDKHNGVIAGAGSGKTEVLVTRIAYLVNRTPDAILPMRILALAFQRKAAQEIEQRLKDRFSIFDVKVKTFHSLGLEILRTAGVEPQLKFGDGADVDYRRLIEGLHNKAATKPDYQKMVIEYVKHYEPDSPRNEADSENKEQFYEYMRNLTFTALDGTKVKSEAEKEIMNFFLSHKLDGKNIAIRYEHKAEWMKYVNKNGITVFPKPDFYFPEHDIYLEHWAIDDRGRVPRWFDRDAQTHYVETMKKKIEKYRAHKKHLIETTSGEYVKSRFLGNLQNRFTEGLMTKYLGQKFTFTPIPYEELVERIYYDLKVHVEEIPSQIANFITTAKTYALTPTNIRDRLYDEKNKWSKKQVAFAEIAIQIYDEYDASLRASIEIDFPDMINHAVEELNKHEDLYRDVFDHILVDEYQDLSAQRYKLVKTLMEKNPECKLFAVGDDWQSIMGFAGSNLNYIVRFEDYFDHPAITRLSTNYRSIKSIVDLGAHVIEHNRGTQLTKNTLAKNVTVRPIKLHSSTVDKYSWEEYRRQVAEHCISSIRRYLESGGHPREVMILMRITKSPALINELFRCAKANGVRIVTSGENPSAVPVMSVHQSKGLQAKTVFIVNVIDHTYGFPCTLEDLDVLAPATDGNPRIKEEEERRLFYVAITRAKENLAIYTQEGRQSKFIKEIREHLHEERLGASQTEAL